VHSKFGGQDGSLDRWGRRVRVRETAARPTDWLRVHAPALERADVRRPTPIGATTNTTTRLLRAVGDYARLELKDDTLSTRVIAVDCLTSVWLRAASASNVALQPTSARSVKVLRLSAYRDASTSMLVGRMAGCRSRLSSGVR
jgi:hypothetical protein